MEENKNTPLPALRLPHGVTADTLAKLVTSVLLRQAYCQKHPWAQWLILATMEILHGHDIPKLDSESLQILQGLETQENPLNTEDWTQISNPNLKKDSPKTSSYKEYKSDGEMVNEYVAKKMFSHCNDSKEDVNINKGNNNENTLPSMVLSNSKLLVSNTFNCRDFSAQVTPKIMRRTCSKWVQVKKFSQISQAIQTENSFWNGKEMKDCESQTEFKGSLLNKISHDKEAQTVMIYRKNSSVQSIPSCSSKHKWKLIPISGLPKKKTSSEKMQYKTNRLRDQEKLLIYPLATCAPFSPWNPLYNNAINTQKILDPEKSDLNISRQKTLLNVDDLFPSPKTKTNIVLFHGRPLINSNSEKGAAGIPLKAINGLANIMLEDPRQHEL